MTTKLGDKEDDGALTLGEYSTDSLLRRGAGGRGSIHANVTTTTRLRMRAGSRQADARKKSPVVPIARRNAR
jgi:hypothetical protein